MGGAVSSVSTRRAPPVQPESNMTETMYTTARLAVRHLGEGDVDAMHAVYGDETTMAPIGDGEVLGRTACAEWIQISLRNYEKYGYGMSAVVLRETGDVIGFCGIVHPGGQTEPEIKYAFQASAWGRGFGTETVEGMLEHGERAHGITRMIGTVHPDNRASQHVLRKAGFMELAPRTEEDGSLTLLFERQTKKAE